MIPASADGVFPRQIDDASGCDCREARQEDAAVTCTVFQGANDTKCYVRLPTGLFGIFIHLGENISIPLMDVVTRPDCGNVWCRTRKASAARAAAIRCGQQLQGPPQDPAAPGVCQIQDMHEHPEVCGAESDWGPA